MSHFSGNLMNFHANILGQRIMQPMPHVIPDVNQEQREDVVNNVVDTINNDPVDMVQPKVQETSVIKRKDESKAPVKKTETVDNLNEMILEADNVIGNSPWAMAMDKHLDNELDIDLDLLLENVLLEIPPKKEDESVHTKHTMDKADLTNDEDLQDNYEDFSAPRSSGFISVIRGPEMVFSREELNFLNRNKIIHKDISRRAMPITLHQACVARYLGKLSMEGMLSIIAGAKMAQNYYHYMTMASQPFFNELTTRYNFFNFFKTAT